VFISEKSGYIDLLCKVFFLIITYYSFSLSVTATFWSFRAFSGTA